MNENNKTKKPTTLHRKQEGQAIVIIAGMMIGMLAMAGLALDGGGMYFMWRDMQNATDASALAAAHALCTGGDMTEAGLRAAAANGFENDGSTVVTVHNPPLRGHLQGDPNYVEVRIRSEKPSYFIHVVHRGPLELTNSAVSFCQRPFDSSNIQAITALSQGCSSNWTVNLSTSSSYVFGGVHSNQGASIQGSSGNNNPNNIIGGTTYVVGANVQDQGVNFWADEDMTVPTTHGFGSVVDNPLGDFFAVSEFFPGGRFYEDGMIINQYSSPSDDSDYGNNGRWTPANNRVLRGLYFIDGDVRIGNQVNLHADGVTIIATGTISANQFNNKDVGAYAGGVVFYSLYDNPCGNHGIHLNGNSSIIDGAILAPHGNIQLSGSELWVNGAVIGGTVEYSASDSTIIYRPDMFPSIPGTVRLTE
ncbi:MAG: hypothetical protein EA396_06925 [Anaerolineaceae bacterium]|nr:MAG: hypothetical protein EA396_06925 [Anaerolineaceae bacterium]